jgi:hypothetical protein
VTSAGTYFISARDDLQLVGYLQADNIAYQSGGTLTFSGPWNAPAQCTTTHTSVPAGYSTVSIRYAGSTRGLTTSNLSGASNGEATSFTGPCAATDKPVLEQTLVSPRSASQASQSILEAMPSTETTYTIDVQSKLLPWIGAPQVDLATGTISIPRSGDAAVDAFELVVSYTRPSTSRFYQWRLVGPVLGDVTLPQLPAELAINPRSTDEFGTSRATAYDWSSADGFGDVRGNFEEWISAPVTADLEHPLTRTSTSDLAH